MLITSGSAKGKIAIDTSQPLNPNNRRSLRLEITDMGRSDKVGVANIGYWDIAVRKGHTYRFSCYLCCTRKN